MQLPLIFLHMYKAGGTSMRRFIRQQYKAAKVVEVNGSIEELVRWREQPSEERRAVDLLLGHQFFGNHEYLRPDAKYLTVLRDPIERVISFYYYVLRKPGHYLYRYGFEDHMSLRGMFENTRCIELDNLQVRMLNPQPAYNPPMGEVDEHMFQVAAENLKYIASHGIVGVVERMPELLEVLQRDEGWDPSKMVRANVTTDRPEADSLDEATLDIVRKHNRFDTKLYDLAAQLFEARLMSSRAAQDVEVSSNDSDPLETSHAV